MNENIDLTKILKGCPKGTRFYTTVWGEVSFYTTFIKDIYSISIRNSSGKCELLTKEGCYFNREDAECIIFPSKDQRDWSKFTAPWYKKEKFDPKTLQPFDKVIVRISNEYNKPWFADFVSHRYKENEVPEVMSDTYSNMVIPFNEDTKHLLGTTEEAPEYYRYWED